MNSISFLRRLGKNSQGATAVEYGLIASLIVVASILAFSRVADESNGMWGMVSSKVVEVMGG